jgi:hypothetical protein
VVGDDPDNADTAGEGSVEISISTEDQSLHGSIHQFVVSCAANGGSTTVEETLSVVFQDICTDPDQTSMTPVAHGIGTMTHTIWTSPEMILMSPEPNIDPPHCATGSNFQIIQELYQNPAEGTNDF